MAAASQAQGSKSGVRPSPSSFSSTSVSNNGFTFLKRDGRFRIWTSLRNCSPRGFCRGQTDRHQSLQPSQPHSARGQPARSVADPKSRAIPRPGPHNCILGNLRPGRSQPSAPQLLTRCTRLRCHRPCKSPAPTQRLLSNILTLRFPPAPLCKLRPCLSVLILAVPPG